MPQLTTAQARVYDPVLTRVAQGYRNRNFVGGVLFPTIGIGSRAAKIITFGTEDFELYATARAPGTNTRRVHIGYSSGPVALEQHALEGFVPFELLDEATNVPGIRLGARAVNVPRNALALRLEKAQADLATNAANYAASNKLTSLAGVTLWSDLTSATSDPIGNIETGKEAVRASVGVYPNKLVIGAQVLKALRQHAKIIGRTVYTDNRPPSLEYLAMLFGVDEVAVGSATYKDASGALVDVWGKVAVLAYTVPASVAEEGAPTYGYTYRLDGYPLVERPYEDRSQKSWAYPVTDEVQPVIAAPLAGYLISPAVA